MFFCSSKITFTNCHLREPESGGALRVRVARGLLERLARLLEPTQPLEDDPEVDQQHRIPRIGLEPLS